MRDKLWNFVYKQPHMVVISFWLILFVIVMIGASIWKQHNASNLENVKDAQYVLYTSEGEMKAVNAETIVDMNTGYQYRIFEINGQYVCAPAIDEDGTVYKTVE